MTYARWPTRPATPPRSWSGLRERGERNALTLPDALSKQVSTVDRYLGVPGVHALWLSGSAARKRMRRGSDIDWVVVTELPFTRTEWPTSRHAFQSYTAETFVTSVSGGQEFAVWQLAYAHPIHLEESFRKQLLGTQVGARSDAVARKRATLERRRRMIRVLIRCGAFVEARRELLLLVQQYLRLEILEAGYVPGCRVEAEEQLASVSPSRYARWCAEHSDWIAELGSSASDSKVAAVAEHYEEVAA